MTRKIALLGCLLFSLAASSAIAGNLPDFSGSYVLLSSTSDRGSPSGGWEHKDMMAKSATTLEIAQSSSTVAATQAWKEGLTNFNQYQLDGKEGVFHSADDVEGRCRAHIKNNQLIIESTVVRNLPNNDHPSKTHSRSVWVLSADGKTLSITQEDDWPDIPINVHAIYKMVYTRK